jgi:hypothetical protein
MIKFSNLFFILFFSLAPLVSNAANVCDVKIQQYVSQTKDYLDELISITAIDESFNDRLLEINKSNLDFIKGKLTKQEYLSRVEVLRREVNIILKKKKEYDINLKPDPESITDCLTQITADKANIIGLQKIASDEILLKSFFDCSKYHDAQSESSLDFMELMLDFIYSKITKEAFSKKYELIQAKEVSLNADHSSCVSFLSSIEKKLEPLQKAD